MDPPLRERLRSRETTWEGGALGSQARMARTGMLCCGVAAGFALLAAALPDTALGDERVLLGVTLAVALAALALAAIAVRGNAGDSGLGRTPLTGLLDKAAFSVAFDAELERARRSGRPLGLVLVEVDPRHREHEPHGGYAEDVGLPLVTQSLEGARRSFDSVARLDAGEFGLLAPDCDESGGYVLAERVRVGLSSGTLAPGPGLTVSLGVATWPTHGKSPESLLASAAHALRVAKGLGGDRTVISSAEVPGAPASLPRAERGPRVGLAALLGIAEALDVQDNGTTTHSQRVGRYAELTARELGLAPESIERVRLAGILHDIGRIGIPEAVMAKREPLTEGDRAWVRSHPEIGARMVGTTEYDDIRGWILAHHERPDGRGYPAGLTGEDLPLEARILAASDAYEAMTSERPYRPAMAAEDAAQELRRGAGKRWDEQVVEALLRAV